MALIQRGGCTFYVRSLRRGGKVTSEYVGSGVLALGAARSDAERREARAIEAAAWHRERSRLEAAERMLADLCRGAILIAHAALEARGFHQHKRQWRRKRRMSETTETTPAISPESDEMTSTDMDEVLQIMKRAQKGDQEVLPRLRELFDTNPSVRDHLLEGRLRIGALAEDALIELSCGPNLLAREIQIRDLDRTAADLAGADATATERLLARRAAQCWQAVQWYESDYHRQITEGVSLSQGVFLQKLIDGAHRRLLQTLRTLELVRRLARPGPSVAVSVAQKVTVEAPVPAAAGPSELDVADLLRAAPAG